MSVATVWLGSPLFDQSGVEDDGARWFNYAHGVKWIAHECTHRWGLDMSFQNPTTGQTEKLTDSVGHWREGLDTTAMFPVWGMFLEKPRIGGSIMGGSAWQRGPDGRISTSNYPSGVPGGYSALDLYIMGMLPANQVPDTSFAEALTSNRLEGAVIPVRIADILKVMGQRKPSSADSQKVFHMMFYVVHEPLREADPAALARAQGLGDMVAKFFLKATGGVMKVTPSGS
jgi:hypothetical protein